VVSLYQYNFIDRKFTKFKQKGETLMKTSAKVGIGLLVFGIIGILLICTVSLALYGRVYMYDGYEYTGVLWTICFISIGLGILTLSVGSVLNLPQEKKSHISKLWNDPKALYLISAALFVVSLVLCVAINAGFMLVNLIFVAFVIIVAVGFNSWKFFSIEDFSKVLLIAMVIGLIMTIMTIIVEGPDVTIGWQEEWHKCYNCNGTGKVTNDYGYRVKCSRCNGVGGLYY
jgi:hypothetical protein